ncbi:MAG: laccase domain-containing protein, partial [Candidatus Omnitrophica bacterium]|nr:laccase domain-containing protein [Candidatus Omnitrophota bacterium]
MIQWRARKMAVVRHDVFLGREVVAFTSDVSIDFHKGDLSGSNDFILTGAQRDWLSREKVTSPHKLIFPKQVHGDVVWKVTEADVIRRGQVEADAAVTNVTGLPIAVRTADCLPLLFYDPHHRVIAAVHAGWKSSQLRIVFKTIEMMRAIYGVDPARL